MIDEEVLVIAAADGFELEERPVGGEWCWGWVRGEDTRWPAFRERREAVGWMRERLHRVAVFR